MHIGITVSFKHSVFSSGASQTSLALAELFSYLGDTCTLIHGSDEQWWNDVKSLQGNWPCIQEKDVVAGQFDRILEVTLCPSLRRLAPCIWIVRKTPLFLDMEACVVPFPLEKRDLTGIAETWVQEELATPDDIQYLELITRKPVRKVPFLWSAIAIEAYRKETKPPIWQQTAKPGTFTIHVCETNTSSSSSCLIPLCIYREGLSSHELRIHNADGLKDSEYFRKNLWDNLTGDLPLSDTCFVGRQRIVDLPMQPNTLILAHSRFTTVRPYHLDALWCGIPLVHNASLLNCLGADVERGYYANNDISAGCQASERVIAQWITQEGLFRLRKSILERFGILSTSQKRWKDALSMPMAVPLAVPVALHKRLRIGFSDMWENFNPSYNFFTLLLASTFPNYSIEVSSTPDVLIFGPFGSAWKTYTCPKIHYTGENTPPIKEAVLNLGFERRTEPGYIRLPLWVLEIDWFSADPVKIQNPVPIPFDGIPVSKRDKFCAFVVSNPCQPVRNNAFHTLCKYKEVDSAGRLYNTLGSDLFAGAGGGGGERAKVEFLRQYRFCLAYENAASPGYVTEKLFHAKAAGCVPIYWGAPDVELDFDMGGVIDARGKSDEELVSLVRRVEEDPVLWETMAKTPLLNEKRKEETFELLSKVAHAIVDCVAAPVPAPAQAEGKPLPQAFLGNTVFVTGCSSKFVDTLIRYWIPPILAQKKASANVHMHVYLLHDVTEEERKAISAFPVTLFDLPKETVFPDCWNPQHFLWKLWLLRETCQTVTSGYPVVYLDVGVYLCRWPKNYLARVKEEGICLLEDTIHDNRHMCSKEFCKEMNLSETELTDIQIWAGCIPFLAGHPAATRLFDEAWVLGQNRTLIVGEKWTGVDAENRPYGHRHDQSILSVLTKRHGLARHPLGEVYCQVSLRHTFLLGLSLYVHRGFFIVNDPIAMGVHGTWIINLDRRPDRMERFPKVFREKAIRFPAVDGRSLSLTPEIVTLFAESKNIAWRKGVMGCALSHIALWKKLLADKEDIETYLILEDDAVLRPQCIPFLNHMHDKKLFPADWDILYLGGILPPNRDGFQTVIEPVNECVARVKKNTLFSAEPTRNFHFCAYSYIIRRSGAKKLLDLIKERGCWAPADHLLCNSVDDLNIYFTTPLMAGCYQDDDPRYVESEFNVFGKEAYDSDLRNEERFTEQEIASVCRREKSPVFFHTIDGLFEQEWLEDLLGKRIVDIRTEIPIVLYQRPHCEKLKEMLRSWPAFTLLHLSDEGGIDPIDIYDWPSCKGVVRNYVRANLPEKVVTIPLGYHWASAGGKTRDLAWSFIGAEYGGRNDKLQAFKGIQPNMCVLLKEWNSPDKRGKEEVVDTLQRSLCVPCPGGVNAETFRFYEALEAGAVPIVVEEGSAFLSYVKQWIPLATSPDWPTAARVAHGLIQRPDLYREYRKSLLQGWVAMKQWARMTARKTLSV
jgi:GR25 family glycosyltransferase involved in LPS biosynthesis